MHQCVNTTMPIQLCQFLFKNLFMRYHQRAMIDIVYTRHYGIGASKQCLHLRNSSSVARKSRLWTHLVNPLFRENLLNSALPCRSVQMKVTCYFTNPWASPPRFLGRLVESKIWPLDVCSFRMWRNKRKNEGAMMLCKVVVTCTLILRPFGGVENLTFRRS